MMEQTPEAAQEVRQSLMTSRIIVFSLAAGVSFFIGFVITSSTPEASEQPMLWMMTAGLAVSAVFVRAVIPGIVFGAIRKKIAHRTWQPAARSGQLQKQTDEGLLMAALQLKTIIAHFPLRLWLDGWLERQKRWLDEERSLGSVDRSL